MKGVFSVTADSESGSLAESYDRLWLWPSENQTTESLA